MFTGIIEQIGSVINVQIKNEFLNITVQHSKIFDDIKIGDSISINGVCVTVSDFECDRFISDIMPETVRKTNFRNLRVSDKVNLERALRLCDRMGGHIVTGHVDGIGYITSKERDKNSIQLTVKTPDTILRYIVLKGSITLDGTSLTVSYVDQRCFKVCLIPLTARSTILGLKDIGDTVNIECDILGKYIEKLASNKLQNNPNNEQLTFDFLRENGF